MQLFPRSRQGSLSTELERNRVAEEQSLRDQVKTAQLRFELAGKSEGLWDMVYPDDGQVRPDTPFWWSEHFRELLGFQNERDFPNVLDSWGSRLHVSDKDRTFAAFAAHLNDRSGKTPYSIEYQLQLKSGEYRWFLARGFTLRDLEGKPLRVTGSVRDIHEEKLLNQRITASKDLRLELAGKGEALWDMEYPEDGQLRPDTPFWWSEYLRKLLGFQNERDFPNVLDSWGSRLHASDKDRTFTAFAAHLNDRSGKTPYDIEYQLQLKSGEYRWFLARGFTLRDLEGKPLRVTGSVRDIHDEKLLNQRLTASSDRLHQAIACVRGNMTTLMRRAVETTDSTNSKMKQLNSRSQEIHKINDTINNIAKTSNVLSLNAMIESARAGDAGRGFRVVAGEVRRLAQTTSTATGDVTRETQAIEEDIGQVASELHRFQDIIEQIGAIQNQLTSTIEDQTSNLSSAEMSLRS